MASKLKIATKRRKIEFMGHKLAEAEKKKSRRTLSTSQEAVKEENKGSRNMKHSAKNSFSYTGPQKSLNTLSSRVKR